MDEKIRIKGKLLLEAMLSAFSPGMVVASLFLIIILVIGDAPAISEEAIWLKIIALLISSGFVVYGIGKWGDDAQSYFDEKLPERLTHGRPIP